MVADGVRPDGPAGTGPPTRLPRRPRWLVRGSLKRGRSPARQFRGMLRARSVPLRRPLLGRTRRRTLVYRRPMDGRRRGLWPRARWLVRGRRGAGFRRLCGLLRQRLLPDAQRRAQRDQKTGQDQNASVSHGYTHRATYRSSGEKKPVVILQHPQCRHKLQRPADHPGRYMYVVFLPPSCMSLEGPREALSTPFRISALFRAPISIRF